MDVLRCLLQQHRAPSSVIVSRRFGIGISQSGLMTAGPGEKQTNVVICSDVSGVVAPRTYRLLSRAIVGVSPHATAGVTLGTCTRSDSSTTMTWTRLFDNGDASDAQINAAGQTPIVFAVGTAPSISGFPSPMSSVMLDLAGALMPSPSPSAPPPPPAGELTATMVLTGSQYPLSEAPIATTAFGIATVFLDVNTLKATLWLTLFNVVDQTAAHIHAGSAISSGGVVLTLPTGNLSGHSVSLSAAEAESLGTGGAYINVHTTANPAGTSTGVYDRYPLSVRMTRTFATSLCRRASSADRVRRGWDGGVPDSCAASCDGLVVCARHRRRHGKGRHVGLGDAGCTGADADCCAHSRWRCVYACVGMRVCDCVSLSVFMRPRTVLYCTVATEPCLHTRSGHSSYAELV